MKPVDKVSIGGYAFILESEAAAVADSYLKEMSAYYSNPEITDGIEERMAELLRERTPEGGVVSKSTILSIIDILGRPESIVRSEPDSAAPDRNGSAKKKLYRDMDNAKLAGVCSGLSAYFNIDPVIFRVAFIVLSILGMFSFGDKNGVVWVGSLTVPVIYCIMWICMPAARTAQQRWEMRGDDGSAESIRRSVESGGSDVGNALRQVGNAPVWGTLGRIFEVAIGILLIIIAVSGLFVGGLAIFGWQWLGLTEVVREIISEITTEIPQITPIIATPWVKVLALLVYVLPFIGMLYGGIMLLFSIKAPKWHPGLILFVVWLITVIALGILAGAAVLSTTSVLV